MSDANLSSTSFCSFLSSSSSHSVHLISKNVVLAFPKRQNHIHFTRLSSFNLDLYKHFDYICRYTVNWFTLYTWQSKTYDVFFTLPNHNFKKTIVSFIDIYNRNLKKSFPDTFHNEFNDDEPCVIVKDFLTSVKRISADQQSWQILH